MTKITAVRNFHARWPASTIDVTPCEVFSGDSQRGSKQRDFFNAADLVPSLRRINPDLVHKTR